MSKFEIAIEDVRAMQLRREEINRLPLEEIIWTEGGVPVSIDKKTIEDWRFVGLNNIDFITSGEYKEEIK